jgi:hypothetical protein
MESLHQISIFAILHGKWKLDSQYRYAPQMSPFFDSTEIMGRMKERSLLLD